MPSIDYVDDFNPPDPSPLLTDERWDGQKWVTRTLHWDGAAYVPVGGK